MDAIFLSSGNLIADRRFEWARDLADKGDFTAAAGLLAQTLELAPAYASAWFTLGEVRARLDDREGAVAAFRKAADADPLDRHGAKLHLIRLGAAPAAAPPAAPAPTQVGPANNPLNVGVGDLFYGSDGWAAMSDQGFQAYKGDSSELIMEERPDRGGGEIDHQNAKLVQLA